MLIRLHKYLADAGICSRRKAELLIAERNIRVNGILVVEQGTKIDPTTDVIEIIDGTGSAKVIQPTTAEEKKNIYIALHKPIDYISSASNEQGASVLELITAANYVGKEPKEYIASILNTRLYPVGRLDKDSEGLLLLTNDGELTNELTHPRYEHEKEYEVTIDKPLNRGSEAILQKGMRVEEELYQGITIVSRVNKGKRTLVTVILKEGKNRQIRNMFGRLGFRVISLKRIRIGKLTIGTLPVGRWKLVNKEIIY